jgi:hypothetical protein
MAEARCVVCGGRVEEAMYPNAWETARKRYPCCSKACVERFDPMQHWIPARFPQVASDEEQKRLLGVMRTRIIDGDEPAILVREMLVAGIPPAKVRGVLIEAGADAQREKRQLRWIQAVVMLVTFRWLSRRPVDKRDPKKIAAAAADVDLWEKRRGDQ